MATENDKTFLQDLTSIVRKHFGSEKPTEQKFKEVKTADGTEIITYEGETPEVGMAVWAIVGGQKMAVPDGVHTMEDGSKIETKDSFIVAVVAGEPEENTNPAETVPTGAAPMTPPTQMPMKEVETLIKERHFEEMKPVNEKITALENENVALKNEVKTLTETLAANQASIEVLTEKFGKYEAFSADVQKLLSKPQEEVKPEEKQFQREDKPKNNLSMAEWKAKYMNS